MLRCDIYVGRCYLQWSTMEERLVLGGYAILHQFKLIGSPIASALHGFSLDGCVQEYA